MKRVFVRELKPYSVAEIARLMETIMNHPSKGWFALGL